MRWICKDDIEGCLTDAWRTKAAQAKQKLITATTDEQRKVILKKASSSKIWRDFYKLLPDNLKKKCWYCEAEDIRSDMPVDHFRPKNKVENEANHGGYWWLAFDWENYRCACTYCNSLRAFDETVGGKACKFPITATSQRAFTSADSLNLETPNFLDPFNPDDEKLLWFDNDGKPISKPGASAEEVQKVENSIDIFHLHETKIVRARNNIRIEVDKLIQKIRNNTDVQTAKNSLKKMVRDSEKLSRAAIVYMRAHRDLDEVKEILELD